MQPKIEKSEKAKRLAAAKRIIANYTSTIAVIGALAGGHMLGRLPDNLFGRGIITKEWLVFAPLVILAEGIWVLSYLHDRSKAKELPSQRAYSAAIIAVSIILAIANLLSPY